MKTTNDMFISCFKLISISSLEEHKQLISYMKIVWLYFIFYNRNSWYT